MQVERRKFHDPSPRITYAPSTIKGRTKLVQRYSYAHAALLALDFEELMAEHDFVLLKAPPGFEIAQERCQ